MKNEQINVLFIQTDQWLSLIHILCLRCFICRSLYLGMLLLYPDGNTRKKKIQGIFF